MLNSNVGSVIMIVTGITVMFMPSVLSSQYSHSLFSTVLEYSRNIVTESVLDTSLSKAVQGTIQDVWYAVNYSNNQFQGTI